MVKWACSSHEHGLHQVRVTEAPRPGAFGAVNRTSSTRFWCPTTPEQRLGRDYRTMSAK